MGKYIFTFNNKENINMNKVSNNMVNISGGHDNLEEKNNTDYKINSCVDSA